MRFFLKFKWIFLFIGFRLFGGRGAFLGFLLGSLIDSMISPPTIKFRFYTNHGNFNQHQWGSGAGSSGPYYYNPQLDEAYRTLGITEAASDDEVRQAYRRLALKYHPDRLASQGEQVRLEAEKKILLINQAKEVVFKARGLK